MSEKIDAEEKKESGLASLPEEDLDNIAGGAKTQYWTIKHNTGCGGTFTTDIEWPKYCVLCGEEIYWG